MAAALVLAGSGCGSKDRPVKVEGSVTLDGKPVEGALVSFLPDGAAGRFAFGTTARDGSFRLTTYKPDDGALPGDYKVTVTLIPADGDEADNEGGQAAPGKAGGEDGKQMMAAMGKMAAARQKALEKSPVPAVYREASQTPLRQTVPTQGKVTLALRGHSPRDAR